MAAVDVIATADGAPLVAAEQVDVRIDPESKNVEIDMTLTAPNCPVAGTLPGEVERAAAIVPGLGSVKANLVFSPPWNPTFMSEEARLELGMF